MKKLFFFLVFIISALSLSAQLKSAVLQASGLTCAMCTKAINNSLEELAFVESVKPDIKNSAFLIVFKTGKSTNIDEIKKAVEDAGFSVAKLKLTMNFSNVAIKNNEHVEINGHKFHFVKVMSQNMDGVKEITIVDKNFLTSKEYRKYAAATNMPCIETGRAADCCKKEGVAENDRVYHATI